MSSEKVSEESLRGQGVVPQFVLDDIEEDECRHERAPWAKSSNARESLPPFRQGCPPLLFGGSVLGKGIHSGDDFFASTMPYRVVRLALRYGINALDTSPFYHPSEISLGRILKALRKEHPRQAYYLQTKAGRYGPTRKDFDYSPERVRQSIKTSLDRLETDYLDSTLMHDVEFVADQVGRAQEAGFAARNIAAADHKTSDRARQACGIAPASASDDEKASLDAQIHGDGDKAVLEAIRTLFALKEQSLTRNVGIAGLPLPVLLRLSRLVASQPPYRPLDVIQSYSHHTLNNDLLIRYQALFDEEPTARRLQREKDSSVSPWLPPLLINASPFSMGLLLDKGPPSWHPASDELKQASLDASKLLREQGQGAEPSLVRTAAGFGMRGAEKRKALAGAESAVALPTIVGVNNVEQVHDTVETYRVLLAGSGPDSLTPDMSDRSDALVQAHAAQLYNEKLVTDLLEKRGLRNWMWASGS